MGALFRLLSKIKPQDLGVLFDGVANFIGVLFVIWAYGSQVDNGDLRKAIEQLRVEIQALKSEVHALGEQKQSVSLSPEVEALFGEFDRLMNVQDEIFRFYRFKGI